METLELINGNDQKYTIEMPKVVLVSFINETALKHLSEYTGLEFTEGLNGWHEAQPTKSEQITKLFIRYHFESRYFDNNTTKNTLYIKSRNTEQKDFFLA